MTNTYKESRDCFNRRTITITGDEPIRLDGGKDPINMAEGREVEVFVSRVFPPSRTSVGYFGLRIRDDGVRSFDELSSYVHGIDGDPRDFEDADNGW